MSDSTEQKEMLRQMILLRAFEEKLEELYQRQAMFGSTHSYRGQVSIAVGVCAALQRTDLIASHHRGTGHLIAKGLLISAIRDPNPVLCFESHHPTASVVPCLKAITGAHGSGCGATSR